MNKKDAKWKQISEFQKLIISRENPLPISVERQVTNENKVTVYWEEDSCSSLFDESETYKVSVSIKLAELLISSGLCTKESKSSDAEADLMKLLLEKIEEKNKAVSTAE